MRDLRIFTKVRKPTYGFELQRARENVTQIQNFITRVVHSGRLNVATHWQIDLPETQAQLNKRV